MTSIRGVKTAPRDHVCAITRSRNYSLSLSTQLSFSDLVSDVRSARGNAISKRSLGGEADNLARARITSAGISKVNSTSVQDEVRHPDGAPPPRQMSTASTEQQRSALSGPRDGRTGSVAVQASGLPDVPATAATATQSDACGNGRANRPDGLEHMDQPRIVGESSRVGGVGEPLRLVGESRGVQGGEATAEIRVPRSGDESERTTVETSSSTTGPPRLSSEGRSDSHSSSRAATAEIKAPGTETGALRETAGGGAPLTAGVATTAPAGAMSRNMVTAAADRSTTGVTEASVAVTTATGSATGDRSQGPSPETATGAAPTAVSIPQLTRAHSAKSKQSRQLPDPTEVTPSFRKSGLDSADNGKNDAPTSEKASSGDPKNLAVARPSTAATEHGTEALTRNDLGVAGRAMDRGSSNARGEAKGEGQDKGTVGAGSGACDAPGDKNARERGDTSTADGGNAGSGSGGGNRKARLEGKSKGRDGKRSTRAGSGGGGEADGRRADAGAGDAPAIAAGSAASARANIDPARMSGAATHTWPFVA